MKNIRKASSNILTGLLLSIIASPAFAAELLINNSSLGFYNDSIGDLYPGDQSDPFAAYFPGPDDSTIDPVSTFTIAPDLSGVTELGSWLSDPESAISSDFWSEPQVISSSWPVNTETAIIYEIDGGSNGLENVVAELGVDNGIYVWLNGDFKFGALAPGGGFLGEYTVDLGTLDAGTNYLQVLREDHGLKNNYLIEVFGDFISASPTEPPIETPTEPPTETPTEPPTETPTEPPTETPTEPPTESPTAVPEPMIVFGIFTALGLNAALKSQRNKKSGMPIS